MRKLLRDEQGLIALQIRNKSAPVLREVEVRGGPAPITHSKLTFLPVQIDYGIKLRRGKSVTSLSHVTDLLTMSAMKPIDVPSGVMPRTQSASMRAMTSTYTRFRHNLMSSLGIPSKQPPLKHARPMRDSVSSSRAILMTQANVKYTEENEQANGNLTDKALKLMPASVRNTFMEGFKRRVPRNRILTSTGGRGITNGWEFMAKQQRRTPTPKSPVASTNPHDIIKETIKKSLSTRKFKDLLSTFALPPKLI